MQNKLIAVSAAAVAVLFIAATSVERAAAQRGGRDGGPSAGPSIGRGGGPPAGSRFDGRGPSGGPRFDGRGPSTRSFSRDGSRSYGYTPRFDRRDFGRRGDGRRHVRRFRGHRFFYGAVPFYGAYAYGSCAYYYDRAVATGSGYWWDRYYACIEDYD
jgi:hypothetical protein